MTLGINDTQCNTALPFCSASHFIYNYAECRYADCHYAQCHYAECRYAECRYAKCHYAEGRGAIFNPWPSL